MPKIEYKIFSQSNFSRECSTTLYTKNFSKVPISPAAPLSNAAASGDDSGLVTSKA